MGQSHGSFELATEARRNAERFDDCEIKVIKETFKDLCHLSGESRRIDKETFLQYFPLPGLLGERLFAVFDKKGMGEVDYEEFVSGLAVTCRGTWDEKVEFIFNIYDVDGTRAITREELAALLNHVPRSIMRFGRAVSMEGPAPPGGGNLSRQVSVNSYHGSGGGGGVEGPQPLSSSQQMNRPPPAPQRKAPSHPQDCKAIAADATARLEVQDHSLGQGDGHSTAGYAGDESSVEGRVDGGDDKGESISVDPNYALHNEKMPLASVAEERGNPPPTNFHSNHTNFTTHTEMHHRYHEYTNQEIVDEAFDTCDLNQDGKLSYSEFRLWVERNPVVTHFLQSVFPYDDHRDWCGDNKHLPFIHNHNDLGSVGSPPSAAFSPPGLARLASEVGADSSAVPSGAYYDNIVQTLKLLREASEKTCNAEVYAGIQPLIGILEVDLDTIMATNTELGGTGDSRGTKVGIFASQSSSRLRMGSSGGPGLGLYKQRSVSSVPNDMYTQGSGHTLHAHRDSMSMFGSMFGTMANGSDLKLSPRSVKAMQHQLVAKSGFLHKQGQKFRTWKQRYCVLVGNCIYYYQHKADKFPRGVMFLTGSFIESTKEEDMERKGFWGFEILRHNEAAHRRRMYCTSKVERDSWVHELRRASEVIPIEEDFEIGQELGKGRFSKVCVCVNKKTLERKAVKVIEKATMDAEEKELLRAEIAIMKLVNHPNIIRMENIYESRENIYIVMELHNGGELFDRIVGRPRFSEDEAFIVIHPLAESVAYLHEMGIVHRDLKPENILCGASIGDIKIADFGLSKLVLPDEIMKLPCGTLSYVAPEVLTLNGYGKEADIWSVGTIMYLLLRGRLPFDGETREEIIESTINGTLDTSDDMWDGYSKDDQEILLGMLNKDAKRRMTAAQVLDHPWITTRVARRERNPDEFAF